MKESSLSISIYLYKVKSQASDVAPPMCVQNIFSELSRLIHFSIFPSSLCNREGNCCKEKQQLITRKSTANLFNF